MNYYLSEMNVSAKHGGGLTLLRILGEGLYEFDGLIRLIGYDAKFESDKSILNKEINLFEDPGEFRVKKMPPRFTKDYFTNQFKRVFHIRNPRYIERHYYERYYTEYLQGTCVVNFERDRFLIVPQKTQAVYYSNYLHRTYNLSYVTWLMDDHLLTYDINSGEYTYPPLYEAEFAYHLQHAGHVFVISNKLGQFYRKRFGVNYTVLFSPANFTGYRKEFGGIPDRTLRLCHFGRIWKWTLDAAELLAEHLEETDAEIDIYSWYEIDGPLKKNPRVRVKNPVGENEVNNKLREYDAITILYGFKPEVRVYSEFNISTKMSECFASGIPTLMVGPEYGAMTEFARQHQCALLVTEPGNPEQWKSVNQLRDFGMREELLGNARKVAGNITSVSKMREVWENGWKKIQ